MGLRRFGQRVGALVLALSVACSAAGCQKLRSLRNGDASAHLPQTAEYQNLSRDAQSAIDRHDHATALVALNSLLNLDPRQAEVHQRLGVVYQAQGKLNEAESEYSQALKFDAEYVLAMVGLGQVQTMLGRPTTGLKHIDQALELDPGPAEAQFARGQTLEALGRTDEALAAYFRTLERNPGSATAMLRIATIQLARNQPEQALARLNHALDLIPEDPEAHHQRGLAYLALNRPAQAAPDLKFAAQHLPDRADIVKQLARANGGISH